MISKDDIIAMAETSEQKKFWNIDDEILQAAEQPEKIIEQEYDGMKIVEIIDD